MKSTIDWLDAAKQQHDLSDYAIAPLLGVTRSQLSRYRKGHDYLSDDAAIKLAELLGMDDPSLIIASAHAERAKSPAAKAFWERWAAVAAGVVFAVGLGASPAPASAANSAQNAANSVYYVKY
jgi:transcriptional regulator with XRE-family HTH domain